MDYVRAVYEIFRKHTGWLLVFDQNWICFENLLVVQEAQI
jgi:hypothetical protein